MRYTVKNQLLYASPLAFIDGIFFGMVTVLFSWWMASSNLSISSITKVEAIIGSAFAFKFLWVPIFDIFPFYKILHFFNVTKHYIFHRRGWILFLTYLTCMMIFIASITAPTINHRLNYSFIAYMFIAAIAMASASSLMVAYNCETLEPEDMSITTIAYKMGILCSTSLSTILQEQFLISWPILFRTLSVIIILLVSVIFFAPHDKDLKEKNMKDAFMGAYWDLYYRIKNIRQHVIEGMQYHPYLKHFLYFLSSLAIFITIGFIITCKSQDRLCAPVEKFFITNAAHFTRTEYSTIQIISKVFLPICAIISADLIKKYDYIKSFILIILMNSTVPILYMLYAQANLGNRLLFYVSAFCSVCIISSLLISNQIISKTKVSAKSIIKKSIIAIFFIFLLRLAFIKYFSEYDEAIRHILSKRVFTISFFSAFTIIAANKIIYTIKSAMLYNYQKDLASPKYTLSQMTIMLSIEKFTATLLTSISGSIQTKYGWLAFYKLTLYISLLPIIFVFLGGIFNRKNLLIKDE